MIGATLGGLKLQCNTIDMFSSYWSLSSSSFIIVVVIITYAETRAPKWLCTEKTATIGQNISTSFSCIWISQKTCCSQTWTLLKS